MFVANPRTSAANSQQGTIINLITINDYYHHYQGRTTQWWICLANLKLYFYQFFGDTRARYVSDLSHAAVYAGNTMATTLTTTIITTTLIGKELTNNFLATIVHADKRV